MYDKSKSRRRTLIDTGTPPSFEGFILRVQTSPDNPNSALELGFIAQKDNNVSYTENASSAYRIQIAIIDKACKHENALIA
jgi:hypothetical protein